MDPSRQLQVGGANKAVLGTHFGISGLLGAHTQGPGIHSLDTFFQARKQAAYVLRYAKMFRKYGATPRRGVFYQIKLHLMVRCGTTIFLRKAKTCVQK